jgi:hypothetical protein
LIINDPAEMLFFVLGYQFWLRVSTVNSISCLFSPAVMVRVCFLRTVLIGNTIDGDSNQLVATL